MKINDVPVQSEEEIIAALQEVFSGNRDFAVLERDGQHFIQTDGKSLEYKNPAGLYRALQNEFTIDELAALFMNYYRNINGCTNIYQWQEIPGFAEWDNEEKDDRPPARTLREKIHRLFGL